MNYPLKWHPRFSRLPIPEGVLLLAADHEAHFIPQNQYALLDAGLGQGATAEEILARQKDFFQSALLLQLLRKLETHEVLIPAERHLPEFRTLAPTATPTRLGPNHFILTAHAHHATIAASLSVPAGTLAFWADDYLHPNGLAWLHQQTQPVLLLSLQGEKIMVGPLLDPRQGPCPECLRHQLVWNQPARQWITSKLSVNYFGLPSSPRERPLTQDEKAQIAQAFDAKTPQLWDLKAGHRATHAVRKRPQCATCGNADYMREQMEAPFALDFAMGVGSAQDGGTRVTPAAHTLEKVLPLVSPRTGVATDITPLFGQEPGQIPIYRSAFFRTPPATLVPSGQAFSAISLGKGLSRAQSQVSAIGETLERAAAQVQGDEYSVCASASQLEGEVVLPQALAPFSDTQYAAFPQKLQESGGAPDAVKKYANEEISWTRAWSLPEQKPYWVPLASCFGGLGSPDRDFVVWGSNGAAAGNTRSEAVLQGLYELIEREATAVWWYHRLARPQVPLASVPRPILEQVHRSIGQEWTYWLLNLSHDWRVPVVGAIGQHKATGKFALGFGAHHNPQIAAQRALTELCQLVPIRKQPKADFDFDAIPDAPFLHPSEEGSLPPLATDPTLDQALQHCFETADRLGLKILVTDYSRPDLPLKTVKVMVPGMPHIWPQLASPRLYQIPVDLGWISSPFSEDQLNPTPLYI